ncbi:tumor necrosis factor ligand superfamily member 10 [Sorex araneus]|uniref:tumor necrosis factor ligand superfamily member 10 n=1 Tax=Sorex araneus TaxID=42254 RepID=UPI002433EC07|nr:tumor necrosis factor ligand superfamily member 10 [Sorex araneus]
MKLKKDPPLLSGSQSSACSRAQTVAARLTARTMAVMQISEGPSPAQTCVLILIFTVLLQSLCVSVTYVYFTNELKQLKEKYSRSSIACLLKEDDGLWDPDDGESMTNPCWQVKWQLYQFIKKMLLKTYEKTFTTDQENQQSSPRLLREGSSQRVAAHVTGNRSTNTVTAPSSKNGKILGQKINSWESSRIGHSFMNNFHLLNGELVIHKTGLYYIYSQIYFRIQEAEEKNAARSKQLVQYIYKYTNYPDPILLTKSARTSCWSKDSEYGLYSIYQGGIFELKENDRIFISVTNQHLIEKNQEASYFGAFLIG